ncbi:hypothetical protein HPB52_015048 [Rhipicephalus sanguineus]|uniref:C2H2-type domain-containing protein n=1 Tax=Rhipicephalus sanguineus TaxID=34632 RepID=A0A9D4SXH2_RHISA|nr:hypothetical protein HPB52_015048 [Rhipicephalus sanguineus]
MLHLHGAERKRHTAKSIECGNLSEADVSGMYSGRDSGRSSRDPPLGEVSDRLSRVAENRHARRILDNRYHESRAFCVFIGVNEPRPHFVSVSESSGPGHFLAPVVLRVNVPWNRVNPEPLSDHIWNGGFLALLCVVTDAETFHYLVSRSRSRFCDEVNVYQTERDGNTTTTRSLQCGVCEKVFKYRSQLRTHLFTHVGEKRYACDVCGSRFAQKRNLVIHTRTHTGERPFECSSCPATLTRSDFLKRHTLTHTGERPHECNVCGHRFALKSTLTSHAATHSGKKAFACHVCGRKFALRATLHTRTHTGEKPYTCHLCPATFARLNTLKGHDASHTGERPHECDVCGKAFTAKCNLLRLKNFHSGVKEFSCAARASPREAIFRVISVFTQR